LHQTTQKISIWNDVLTVLRKHLNKDIYDIWFGSITFLGVDESRQTLRLQAGRVTKDWVSSYYGALLDQALAELDFADYTIAWEIEDEIEEETLAADTRERAPDFFFSPKARPASGSPSYHSSSEMHDDGLNPKYTFEKFVVGSCNQFANAAAKAAAEAPGTSYNPLFIYGGVGLGKTHLMHAIGHAIKQQSPHKRVAYISSERFMNELIDAIRFNKTPIFRDRYRSIDVLLMDDVQFLAGKDRTQEEFFHTFNTLYNAQKQIVVSSDCPPREIPTVEERLHSRFEWGLIADLEPPDLETKVAILKRKADLDGIVLDDEIAIYIASKVQSNVRELEGSLVRLVAISSMTGEPISKSLVQQSMKNILASERPAGLTMEKIIRTVADYYKMSVEEIKAKNNSRGVTVPRQVAMYLCKKLTTRSFPDIGREFGGKHHTTVMHSVEKIKLLCETDRNFHKQTLELIDRLSN
jgi:chromosomal replication initiator protein